MFGAFHKVDNIVVIEDYNKIQLDGFVKDIMDVSPLSEKWRAFGWHTIEIDGHDIPALQAAFAEAAATKGKPTAIVANTIKAKASRLWRIIPNSTALRPRPPKCRRRFRSYSNVD